MKNAVPIRESAAFPSRITLCVSANIDRLLFRLKSNSNIHVPQLLRNAIEEYVIKYDLEILAQEKTEINLASSEK